MADKTYKTLDDIINRDDRFDVNKIMFYTITDGKELVIQDLTLFDIYRDYIVKYVTSYAVTKEQRERYLYRPHLLSADIYGTPDLYWMILWLNDRESPSNFRLGKIVKLIPISKLKALYDTIVTKSTDRMYANWTEYLRQVGEDIPNSDE